ncbi:MAG TPA: hypothetical protein DCF49_09085 [Lachnospiraceae bacterium]|nr:hypothetical protein [Lachnospiraceae bacterium]
MLNDLKYRFTKFMQGRYGVDSLSRFMSVILLIFIILGMFIRIPLSGPITLLILVVLYFRMFSRNISRRYAENQKFLQLRDRFLGNFSDISSNLSRFKDYHIYKCPQCSQKIRIPRGKGHIMVRCPKCGFEFHKKS